MIITPENSDSLEIGDLTCYLYLPFEHSLERNDLADLRKDNLVDCDTSDGWSHWLMHELMHEVNIKKVDITEVAVTAFCNATWKTSQYFLPHIQSIFYPESFWKNKNVLEKVLNEAKLHPQDKHRSETAANNGGTGTPGAGSHFRASCRKRGSFPSLPSAQGVEPKSDAQDFAIRRWWKNPSVLGLGKDGRKLELKLYEDELLLTINKIQSGATTKQDNVGSKKEDHEEVPFKIEWIDVILFPQLIGILLVKVNLNNHNLTLSQAANFIRAIRKHEPVKLLTFDVPDVRNKSNVRLSWHDIVAQATEPWRPKPSAECDWVFGATLKSLSVATIKIQAEERMHSVVRKRLEQAALALSTGHNLLSGELYDLVSSDEFCRLRKHNMVYRWKNGLILGDPEGEAIATVTIKKGTVKVHDNYKHYAELVRDRAEWGDSWSYALVLAQFMRLHKLIRKTVEVPTGGKEDQKEVTALVEEYIRFRKTFWHNQVSARPAIQLAYRHFCSIYRLESMADAQHKNLEIVRAYLHEERVKQEVDAERTNSRRLVRLTILGGIVGFVLVGDQIHILSTLAKWFHFSRLPLTSQERWAVIILAVFVWPLLSLLSATYRWFKSYGKRNNRNNKL